MSFTNLAQISQSKPDKRSFVVDESLPLPTNKVGIELELENVTKATFDKICESGYWDFHNENSLRGECGELASVPIFGHDIDKALEVITETFKRRKKPHFNQRTSVHIHVDVVDMTKEELIRYFLLYTAFERILFRLCDETRQNNPYCLPNYMSEGTKYNLGKLIGYIEDESMSGTKMQIQRWKKYCAMNLMNIVTIGTVEFRHLHGTIDAKEIKDWIRILLSLKKYAMEGMSKYNDFPDVVSGFLPIDYMKEIFEDDLVEKLYNNELASDLLAGVRCAQDILLYRRLGRATEIIYDKQAHDEPTSFIRISGSELEQPTKKPKIRTRKVKLGSSYVNVPDYVIDSLGDELTEPDYYDEDEDF